MRFNFCTYFDFAYISKGLSLHESMDRHCGDYRLWVLAMDTQTERTLLRLGLANTTVVPMSQFEYPELAATKRDRTPLEYIWTCTPGWLLYVMNLVGREPVSYIDADCYFYGSPEQLFLEELIGNGVAITPHRFPEKYKAFEDSGLYNVGLVYVESDGRACIEEWEQLCLNWCYFRHEPEHPGWYCDQKYWDELVPRYGVHPIQHPGANLAPWNAEGLAYEPLTTFGPETNEYLFVDGKPLIWYHFHGLQFVNGQPGEWWPPPYDIPDVVVRHAYQPYIAALRRNWRRVLDAN